MPIDEKFLRGLPFWSPNFDPDDAELREQLMKKAVDFRSPCWYIMAHACTNYSMTNYFILADTYPEERWFLIGFKKSEHKLDHVCVANTDGDALYDALLMLKDGKNSEAHEKHGGLVIVDPCNWIEYHLQHIDKYKPETHNIYTFMRYNSSIL